MHKLNTIVPRLVNPNLGPNDIWNVPIPPGLRFNKNSTSIIIISGLEEKRLETSKKCLEQLQFYQSRLQTVFVLCYEDTILGRQL